MDSWIRVEERMPASHDEGVLVLDSQGLISLASFYGEEGHRLAQPRCDDEACPWRGWRVWQVLHPDFGGGIHGNHPPHNVTHWMPLPPVPSQ